MYFTKMQGAGNDYVVVEGGDRERDWSRLAMAVCDRHLGIGADSLLVVLPTNKADFRMRIFDADGSEAETCGNGIRCLARYVFEKQLIQHGTDRILVETGAGVRQVRLDNSNGRLAIQANMGRPELEAARIPTDLSKGQGKAVDIKGMTALTTRVDELQLTLNLVSMGNPHAVAFVDTAVVDFPLGRIGPKVERLAIFPNRTNFEIARVLGRDCLEARVWERGVGETLACGSGACAITVASKLLGHTEARVEIRLPGGILGAEWNAAGEVLLSGPAEIVFEGKWPD